MSIGVVKQSLRPLKIAFLVQPNSRSALVRAIKTCTFLWGGQFNPIIPVYRATPRLWKEGIPRNPGAKTMIQGLISAFDPDVITTVGSVNLKGIDLGHREVIDYTTLEESIEKTGVPVYGVGFYDLLEHLLEKEFKFRRSHPLPIIFPKIRHQFSLFAGAIYGSLDSSLDENIRTMLRGYTSLCEPEELKAGYIDHLLKRHLCPITIASLYLSWYNDQDTLYGNHVFMLDANNDLDVIDFWNLRALGLKVLPVPLHLAEDEDVLRSIAKHVDAHFARSLREKRIEPATGIMKARSLPDAALRRLWSAIPVTTSEEPGKARMVQRFHYPRIWDEWARPHDGIGTCIVKHEEQEKEVSDVSQRFRYQPLRPKFQVSKSEDTKAWYANEVELRVFGGDRLYASVLPRSHPDVLVSTGANPFHGWRLSQRGPVNMSGPYSGGDYLNFPLAGEVLRLWFAKSGWNVELSSPGRLATQMLMQVGGVYGLDLIANEVIIDLLKKMTPAKVVRKIKKHEDQRDSNDEQTERVIYIAEKTLGLEKFWAQISRAANNQRIPCPAKYLLRSLMDAGLFKLGLRIQCELCQMHSWYALDQLDYKLICKNCQGEFVAPTHSPDELKDYHFKAVGPFALPNRAYGTLTVLLCLRFFDRVFRASICPMLSFEDKEKKTEVDLAMHIQTEGYRETEREFLLIECKTENPIEMKQRRSMERLAHAFEGAVLVFATLRKELSATEVRILRPLVNKERRNRWARRPYSQLLILTGNELYSQFSVTDTWGKLSAKHESFANWHEVDNKLASLCDATQQLYLDMESRYSSFEKMRDRRLRRGKSITA